MSYAAYVLDIEGTTTPIDFVSKTLFPFARAEMEGFLARQEVSADLNQELLWLKQEYRAEAMPPVLWDGDPSPKSTLPYLLWLMDVDRKSRALKSIQGRIWEEGYRSGALKGEVYPDVVPAIKRWKASGASVYIYSSGSVLAQKLLFASLPEGDLTRLLDGYFDTEVGPKRDPESYSRIAMHIKPGPALFLSDIVEEIEAARKAGLDAIQVLRDGKAAETTPNAADFTAL